MNLFFILTISYTRVKFANNHKIYRNIYIYIKKTYNTKGGILNIKSFLLLGLKKNIIKSVFSKGK